MRTQTLIIALVLFIISSSEINAEGLSSRGIKFGFNSSKFTGKDIPGKGIANIPGLTLGYFINYEVSNQFSLQSELLFTTKGSRINTVGDIYLHNIFTYMEIPVLAKWTFITENKSSGNRNNNSFLSVIFDIRGISLFMFCIINTNII